MLLSLLSNSDLSSRGSHLAHLHILDFAAEQDPICFRGSVRSNLDPFMEYSDAAMVREVLSCTITSTTSVGFERAVTRTGWQTRCVLRRGLDETCGGGSRGSTVGFFTKFGRLDLVLLSKGGTLWVSCNPPCSVRETAVIQSRSWYVSATVPMSPSTREHTGYMVR